MARRIIVVSDEAIAKAPEPSMKDKLLGYANQAADVAEENAPIAGTMIGGMVGGAGGLSIAGVGSGPMAVAGAGIGGIGGKMYQRLSQSLRGKNQAPDTISGNLAELSRSGLGGMAAEVVGQQGAEVLNALRPIAVKGGAQALNLAANIQVRHGERILNEPSVLNDALLPKQRGGPWEAFERYTGLKGLKNVIKDTGRSQMPVPEMDALAVGTANKVDAGLPVSLQDLYSAGQVENHMGLAARNLEPGAARALESGILKDAGKTVDAELAKTYPEHVGMRQDNFDSHAREAFSNVFPRNNNGSINKSRPLLAANEALVSLMSGHPGALAALPLMSPAAWGMGIRAASAATPLAKFLAKYGVAKTAQKMAERDKEEGK